MHFVSEDVVASLPAEVSEPQAMVDACHVGAQFAAMCAGTMSDPRQVLGQVLQAGQGLGLARVHHHDAPLRSGLRVPCGGRHAVLRRGHGAQGVHGNPGSYCPRFP